MTIINSMNAGITWRARARAPEREREKEREYITFVLPRGIRYMHGPYCVIRTTSSDKVGAPGACMRIG